MNYKKSILLISSNRLTLPYPVYPIGLSYIASYLRIQLPDFDVEIFDLNLKNLDELRELLVQKNPAYIGISFRNIDDTNFIDGHTFFEEYKNIVDVVKRCSSSKIIIGGSGFSIFHKSLFEYLNSDFGICGEGEESLYQLIICLEKNTSYKNIVGLVYTYEGQTIVNYQNGFLKKLVLNFENDLVLYYWQKSGMLNIQTKRGCPYKCIYCTYPVIEGRKIRTLDPDEIVRSLSDLYSNYGINYVFFTDSVFNIMHEYNQLLAEKLIDSKIPFNWGAYFSPVNLDLEMLQLYKRAGLSHIEFGTESLSGRQLKNYKKPFSVNDVLEKSELCNKLNVHFAHFLILGGYGETEETLDETFENSRKIENTVFFPYIGMRIYPGTYLGRTCQKGIDYFSRRRFAYSPLLCF